MTTLTTAPSHLDRVLLAVGTPGKYHLLIAFLLCCMQFPVSFSDYLLTFYTITPRHRCRAEANLTLGEYDLRPIVSVNGKRQYSSCELYADPLDHSKGTKPCDDGWEFLMQKGESSVVTEWELVCEWESLAIMLPYMTAIAGMIGGLLNGILSDKYGRKYVLILSLLFHTSFGVFLHFLPLFGVFVTVFSLQAFLIAGVQCTSYLLLMENLPTQWHRKAALAIAVFQSFGQLILAILAWLIRNWRYIQLAISAPGVVVIGYFWLLPRSLAWLVVENRQHSAHEQLARFSNDANFTLTPGHRMQLLKSCKVAHSLRGGYAARHGFETIICSARLRVLAFTQYYIWFVVSLVSKSSVEDIPVLKDNPYSRLFIHGVIELSFIILIFLASSSIGLKLTQGVSLSICGICCIFSAIINHQIVQMRPRTIVDRGLNHFAPLFGMFGKLIASACRISLWLHVIKTFPTGVRGLGLGACMLCSKIAYIFVPYISELDTHSQFMVLAFGGVMSIVGGILSYLLLPDCTDRPLATIPEEVEIGRTKFINDSDIDLQDNRLSLGFIPNIPTSGTESASNSSDSLNNCQTLNKTIIRRLTNVFQKRTQRFLRTASQSVSKLGCIKPQAPDNSCPSGDVFEPVTGFVFKWDQAEPPMKISDFEKELSVYWKPNNDTSEKKINDKHLNTLNILYNIDGTSEDSRSCCCIEFQDIPEEPSDSTL